MGFQHTRRVLQKNVVEAKAKRGAAARGAQLAPGRLDVPKERQPLDQLFLMKRAEELGPIFKVWLPHKLTTCIVGHERARRFLTENEDKIRVGTIDFTGLFPNGFLRALGGDVHRTYRRTVLDGFNATPLEPHDTEIRDIIRQGLDLFVSAPQPVDNAEIRRTLKATTTDIFLLLILGVHRGSDLHDRFVAAYLDYAPDGQFIVVRPRHKPVYRNLRDLVSRQIAAIEADEKAKPSLLRHMIRTGTVDETVLGNLIVMVEVARFDVLGLWTWIVKHLGENPDAVDTIRQSDTPGRTGYTALQAAPRESLRLEQSELLLRVTTDDIVFDGYFIPRDTHVRICVWEAHHDAKTFKDPFRFQCRRFMETRVTPNEFSPFGLDKHRCLGADWTYLLSEILIDEMTGGYDWTIAEDGKPVFGKFHYEPSNALQIHIKPRAGPG